ncbi:MAG: hypothetical protein K2X27_08525 [Candidatus Obscuribacterales bacterium]|nr:hypothetical protein [Candidatus Obscuribacterales bacterium]
MKKHCRAKRSARGSFIAETPLALWMLLILFTFPFLDMATILLRYTFFVAAVRDGVHTAAHSKTFLTNASASELSAVNAAPLAVAQTASAFTEIKVSNVQTSIIATNISSLKSTAYNQPLQQAADTGVYLYEIQTVVQGTISPLVNMNIGVLPGIPGLTKAVPVTVAAREYCEYPQGLDN